MTDPGSLAPQPESEPESGKLLEQLLAPLEGLSDRPVDEHPAAYEQVHAELRRVLQG